MDEFRSSILTKQILNLTGVTEIKILLTEDELAHAKLVEVYLTTANFKVNITHTTTLAECLKELGKNKFDVVLLDLGLPDSKGINTLERVVEKYKEQSIVLLTSDVNENLGIKAVQMGAQDFLNKEKLGIDSLSRAIQYAKERNKLLKQVGRTNQRLKDAEVLANMGSYEIDVATTKINTSDGLKKIFKIDDENFTYKSFLNSFLNRKEIEKKFKDAINNNEKFTIQHKIKINKNILFVRHNGTFNAGKLVGTIQDITKYEETKNELDASRKRYEIIFNETSEAIYASKPDGSIEVCNKSFCDLLGFTMEEVLSDPEFTNKRYKNPDDRKKLRLEIENKGAASSYEVVLVNKNEEEIECSVSAGIWKDAEDNKIGYFGIIRDMTEQKKLAARDGQLKIAEAKSKMKNEFLANMSHEIRTPMNVVIGMTNLLQSTGLNEDQTEYVKSMKSSSENLMKIINSILDFTKIEAGKMVLEAETFNLQDVIEELFQTFKHETKPGVSLFKQLDASLPDNIVGDSLRLNQVLLNLLSNAIKYTLEGEITLKVSILKENDGKIDIKFSVQDTGDGIPEEKQATIFEPFTQASEDNTRVHGGTGLGLAITKQIVELMGGIISVKSEVGKGSNFTFNAIFNTVDNQVEKAQVTKTKKLALNKSVFDASAPIRLLLVEDHQMNQIVATKILEREYPNISIDIAENGLISFEKIEKNNYHVVLMDINMPVLDGISATKKIRTELDKPKNQIPILGLSAHAFSAEVKNCIEAGMQDFISKPINVNDLKTKLNKILNDKNITGELSANKINGAKQKLNGNHNKNGKTKSTPQNIKIPQKLINLEQLKQLSAGDEDNLKFYIQTISDACPADLKSLKNEVNNEDWDAVTKTAHKLKSTIGYMGIDLLKPIIKEIENNSARKEALDKIPRQVEDVIKYCNLAINELEAYK